MCSGRRLGKGKACSFFGGVTYNERKRNVDGVVADLERKVMRMCVCVCVRFVSMEINCRAERKRMKETEIDSKGKTMLMFFFYPPTSRL